MKGVWQQWDFSERSIPVILANWKLDVEDVTCPVNDTKTTDRSRSFVQG
jgi:hypothetical protein